MKAAPLLSLDQLRSRIGCSIEYQGRPCQIIDVLEDGPQLVLQVTGENIIQADQWGDAHRRTPESFSVAVYDPEQGTINPLLGDLFDGDYPE